MQFDKRAGQFRGNDGRFVSRAKVLQLVDAEAARLENKLQSHARNLVDKKITLPDFQKRMIEDLKASHLRMAAFGSGGHKGLTPRHFLETNKILKEQAKFLDGFGRAITNNQASNKQIIARAKSYGISTKSSFFVSEKITRIENGANQAKRLLDPQAKHCANCLIHATGNNWVSINRIVPPGRDCQCRDRCKCQVVYRRWNAAVIRA